MTWRQSSHQVGGLWGERGWLKEVSRKSFPTSFLSTLFRREKQSHCQKKRKERKRKEKSSGGDFKEASVSMILFSNDKSVQ